MSRWAHPLLASGLVLLAVVAAGCGSVSDDTMRDSLSALETPAPVSTPSTPDPKKTCGDPTRSLRPTGEAPAPGRMPAGSFMRTIEKRGRLVAGVDQNTLLFAYRDPFTRDLRGLEIDLLRQVAKAIFGDPRKVDFKAITTAQRRDYVERGKVDIVADAFTITCYRLQHVAFSSVYFRAAQRLLVPKTSTVRGVADLRQKRVCATVGGTAAANIPTIAPGAIPVLVPQRTDCLVALQQGTVDAIWSDDAILSGFAAQDPYTKIVGPRLTDEPYGMAIGRQHPEFVRFVNAVLERLRADGTWAAIDRRWLGGAAPSAALPPPRYRD